MHRMSLVALLIGAALCGCATPQRISLACVPRNVEVYVDGRLLEDSPKELELSKDESHTVFFKGGGYQSQMILLESRERDGEHELTNADLCSRLQLVQMDPAVKIEVDEDD